MAAVSGAEEAIAVVGVAGAECESAERVGSGLGRLGSGEGAGDGAGWIAGWVGGGVEGRADEVLGMVQVGSDGLGANCRQYLRSSKLRY